MRVRGVAALMGVGAFVLYASSAARTVLGGDDGEFAALGAAGGVAHPPGYPLYVLWLRLFAWLPASSPAHRAGLATAVLGALAVVGVFGACRAWKASVAASAMVAAAFAVSPRAWVASTQAEVFALHALIAAAIVGVAGTDRVTGAKRCALLGALAGLGLCDHHSIVLLAPVGLYGVVRGVRESPRAASIVAGLGAFAIALLPYAYVVFASRHPEGRVVWGDARDLSGLWSHFRRAQYGTTSLGLRDTAHRPLAQIAWLLEHVVRDLLALPIVALVGSAKTNRTPWRPGVLAILLSFLLAGPVFVALFPLDVKGLDGLVVERFHLLPLVVIAPLVALGVDRALASLLEKRLFATLAPLGIAIAGAALSVLDVVEHHGEGVEAWMRDALETTPPRAVILGTGDHRLGAMLYAKHALHLREDVEYVDARLLLDDTYRARAGARLDIELVAPVNHSLSTSVVAAQIVATDRPLFLADVFSPAIPAAFPTYPVGPLIRVLPSGAPLPAPRALLLENDDLVKRFRAPQLAPPPVETWDGNLRAAYVDPWLFLASAFDHAGDPQTAAACRSRAAQLAPVTED
jgi:hypothetical protein